MISISSQIKAFIYVIGKAIRKSMDDFREQQEITDLTDGYSYGPVPGSYEAEVERVAREIKKTSFTKNGWYGFDLDGTLAVYDGWKGASHIGKPVFPVYDRVMDLLTQGEVVRIVTARVHPDNQDSKEARNAVESWLKEWFPDHEIQVTHEKDLAMIILEDDRAIQVVKNTGIRVEDIGRAAIEALLMRRFVEGPLQEPKLIDFDSPTAHRTAVEQYKFAIKLEEDAIKMATAAGWLKDEEK